MSSFPFPHDGPIRVVADDRYEVAYYRRNYLCYKRVRELGIQAWQETVEQEIDRDHWWMIVACIERKALA